MRKKIVVFAVVGTVIALAVGVSRYFASSARAVSPTYSRMNTALARGESPQTRLRQVVDGAPWSLTTFTNEVGQVCAGEKVPNDGADGGQGLACRDKATLFDDGPLVYFVGARQLPGNVTRWANVWVWGWASPQVSRVELQLNNCAVVPLKVENGLFFEVFGSATVRSGLGPQQLIAYGPNGAVIDIKPTPVSAPSSPRAKAAGATGLARASCR
jgi:hypothetical protein